MNAARRQPDGRGLRRVIAGLPIIWLGLFFLVPYLLVLRTSLADPVIGQPPYTPLIGADGTLQVTLDYYRLLLGDRLFLGSYIEIGRAHV